jgi:thiamine-monophosphate kinase
MQEFDLIRNYFSKLAIKNKSALNLNDDVFFDKNKKLVISVDTYNEGVHFIDFENPNLVIKKILRSSLSDLICKGVEPKYYFISGSGDKKRFSKKNLSKISNSLKEEQKKYDIKICGGDTTFSKKLNFTVTSVGFSKKIIYRNNSKVKDDIYVTGNIGNSYIGLQILKKRIRISKKETNYFVNEFYKPNIQHKLTKKLFQFCNSSIDISDGLFDDLEKLINKQKLNYEIYLDKIPTSKFFQLLIKSSKFDKIKLISNGDDYQILFTANKNKSRIIKSISKKLSVKITKIGEILPSFKKSRIIDEKGNVIGLKNKGYIHQF